MDICVEYRHKTDFNNFFARMQGRTIALMYDVNTKPYALDMAMRLEENGCTVIHIAYSDEELIPSENNCEEAFLLAKNVEYLIT